jgi:DNA-binding response OmpR family regulator
MVVGPPDVRAHTVALEVGADDVVAASVPTDELLARLAVHLRRRRMLPDLYDNRM